MDLKSVRKRMTAYKKTSRSKSASSKVRIERTVGIVLVVLMGAAAMMLAARRPEPAVSPEMTSKVVAPQEEPPLPRATASRLDSKSSTAKRGAATATATVASAVTITGCLEQDNDVFRLKDTEGIDAPQSRSWKTGFLRRRPATITVVDASHRWKLEKHVGERISVTGSLADREIELKQLSRVTASCS
jgi:hypothetical protein